jgi:uncharacterized membrane protein
MPHSVFSIFLMEIVLLLFIIFMILYFVNKWMNRRFDLKEEQNEILKEALEVLKNKVFVR